MSADNPHHDALVRLGTSTAEAVVAVLSAFAPGEVTHDAVTVIAADASPFGTITAGTVAAGVSYSNGVTGGNVFLAPPGTARELARRMGGEVAEPAEGEAPSIELTELELSAVSEAANQLMASGAGAIGSVLDMAIEISPPETHTISSGEQAEQLFGAAAYATSTTFRIGTAPCRLVQLVPNAFVVRMGNALDSIEEMPAPVGGGDSGDLEQTLTDVKLRVWAELGRTRLPLGDTLALPLGAVVELDRATEAPVDLYVNGVRFASGRLLVSDDERWAIALDEVDRPRAVAATQAA